MLPALTCLKRFHISIWLLLLPCAVFGQQTQQQLEDVQQKIAATEQQVKQQKQQLEREENTLRNSDKALAQASEALLETQQQQQQLIDQQQDLNKQHSQLQKNLTEQHASLAAQLKSAYSMGQHDYSRMLLNQKDTGKLERVLTYYQYFNRARLQQLNQLNQTISQLNGVQRQLEQKQAEIAQTLMRLQQQQQQLLQAKRQQQIAVKKLQDTLKQYGLQLDYLKQNEASLTAKLNELTQIAKQVRELSGLTRDKGKLTWPLRGALLQRFGENRQGGMPSRGIVIQTTEGTAVKSIADGQVIYADWLKGYGWVIVLDHGDGYMSLYGHNQNLLKKPGARINAGETIAQAGMSGGQALAGLYFEIRDKGEAVNPLQWLNQKSR